MGYASRLTCGGLGPTQDDLTVAAIGEALKLEVRESPKAYAMIQNFYVTLHARGHVAVAEMTEARRKMAQLPEGAEPFDIPGVRFSHHRGHCTFHSLIKEHRLKDPVLVRLAAIVDEADVIQEAAVEPAAPGLDLVCRALRRTSKDDKEAVERAVLLYDALYSELGAEGK